MSLVREDLHDRPSMLNYPQGSDLNVHIENAEGY